MVESSSTPKTTSTIDPFLDSLQQSIAEHGSYNDLNSLIERYCEAHDYSQYRDISYDKHQHRDLVASHTNNIVEANRLLSLCRTAIESNEFDSSQVITDFLVEDKTPLDLPPPAMKSLQELQGQFEFITIRMVSLTYTGDNLEYAGIDFSELNIGFTLFDNMQKHSRPIQAQHQVEIKEEIEPSQSPLIKPTDTTQHNLSVRKLKFLQVMEEISLNLSIDQMALPLVLTAVRGIDDFQSYFDNPYLLKTFSNAVKRDTHKHIEELEEQFDFSESPDQALNDQIQKQIDDANSFLLKVKDFDPLFSAILASWDEFQKLCAYFTHVINSPLFDKMSDEFDADLHTQDTGSEFYKYYERYLTLKQDQEISYDSYLRNIDDCKIFWAEVKAQWKLTIHDFKFIKQFAITDVMRAANMLAIIKVIGNRPELQHLLSGFLSDEILKRFDLSS